MIAERFERQAEYCGAMGAPLCAHLLRSAAADYRRGGVVRALFASGSQVEVLSRSGIRFLAALHGCALDGTAPAIAAHLPSCGGDGDAAAAWNAARAFLSEHLERIAQLYDRTPQTNEPARSMPLLAGLLAAVKASPLPVCLLEIGASAGLNTRLDRYRYEGTAWSWGDPHSPLVLRNRERIGHPSSLDAPLRIVERAACDLHPLDIENEQDRQRLRAFVWADQVDRLQRLDDACRAARTLPLTVEKAEAVGWLAERFRARDGTLTVAMHSAVHYYLTHEQRAALQETMTRNTEHASESAPMAWLRFEHEGSGMTTRLTQWPGGAETLIARSDGHGQDIEWLAP